MLPGKLRQLDEATPLLQTPQQWLDWYRSLNDIIHERPTDLMLIASISYLQVKHAAQLIAADIFIDKEQLINNATAILQALVEMPGKKDKDQASSLLKLFSELEPPVAVNVLATQTAMTMSNARLPAAAVPAGSIFHATSAAVAAAIALPPTSSTARPADTDEVLDFLNKLTSGIEVKWEWSDDTQKIRTTAPMTPEAFKEFSILIPREWLQHGFWYPFNRYMTLKNEGLELIRERLRLEKSRVYRPHHT